MLKKRIIPKLLIQNKSYGKLVRPVLVTTRRYSQVFEVGDPLSQAKIYEAQLADELIVLNIERQAMAEATPVLCVIEKLASQTFMPLAVGGGVGSEDEFDMLLNRGADKVIINTAAVYDPQLISRAATRFGAQCVVVSIDFRVDDAGKAVVFVDRATRPSDWSVVDWARVAVQNGAGELMLTDVDRDGEATGLNLDIGREITATVDVPVILSGGCGVAEHFVEGFALAGADAVAAGNFFCFRDQNPMQTRAHVRSAGIAIRMET